MARHPGPCPATFVEPKPPGFAAEADETRWSDGGSASYQGGGQYCYALWSKDDAGRPSARPATVSVDVPSSAATSSPPPASEPAYDPPPADPSRPEPPPADCDPSTDPACQM